MNLLKIYLDSNLISDPSKTKNFKESEREALKKLKNLERQRKIEFYTSEKTKKEIEKHENVNKRKYLKDIYSLIQHIPEKNIIKSAILNEIMFNEATFNGRAEDQLFTELKQIFDQDDAEHIFQAEKNNLDYFLTLDKKTILNRIKQNANRFKKLNLKIHIVSPTQLVQELDIKKN
jgi:predicted nucleic acid-binding protein